MHTPPPARRGGTSGYDAGSEPWTEYAAPAYRIEHPASWTAQKDNHTENAARTRSEWSDAACDCDLLVDYIPGYGETALENAGEASGGTIEPTSIGYFGDAALRISQTGAHHAATYFVADGSDNYAVRASAPTAATALAIARRAASSLTPYGE